MLRYLTGTTFRSYQDHSSSTTSYLSDYETPVAVGPPAESDVIATSARSDQRLLVYHDQLYIAAMISVFEAAVQKAGAVRSIPKS